MGIPYYFYVITRKYAGILLQQLPEHKACQHLLFDYNGLIHPASQKYLKTLQKQPKDIEKGILQEVWKATEEIIDLVKPQQTVQIFIDGVAPIAKMNQQRRRRFLSIYRKKLTALDTLWDSNAISPGTTFMSRLHASLKAHIRLNKKNISFYLSTSDDPGEGEHKIFKRLRDKYTDDTGMKLIYGMDADLIMLSLISNIPNIYLIRDNSMFLDIDALRTGILMDLYHNYHLEFDPYLIEHPFSEAAQEIIESYIVLCFVLGNDFIPHPIHLNLKKGGLEHLLTQAVQIWNRINSPIVDIKTNTIQWTFISQLLDILSMNENEQVYDIVREYKHKKHLSEPDIENYPLVNKDPFIDEMLFKIDKNKWRLYYYKHLFNTSLNDSMIIKNSCDLYIKGILWTYQYYKQLPKDPNWYYPYAYAPSIRDISNHLNIHLSFYENLKKEWTSAFSKDIFVTAIEQLLSILPEESHHCLPSKYSKVLEQSYLTYLFPKEYKLHTFLKNQLWECIPILPPMNIEYIHQILTSEPKLSS
jgi:5'-3' exonuclease